MFTNTYAPHVGGVARSVQFFSEDLAELGHRVLVVAPTFPQDTAVTVGREEVLRVPAIQEFNGSDFSVRIPLPFYIDQQIEKFAPDVVHSHHPFLLGDAAIRVARSRAVPLVFTHHTLYERYTHYVPLDSDKLKSFVVRLATMYANLCSRVVAPSDSIARLLRHRGVRRPIEEIPTGVDLTFFTAGNGEKFRRETEVPANSLIVGHVGRLAPEKNLAYLAEAVAIFMEKVPEAFFLVVGEGPVRSEIRQIFAQRLVADRLRLIGEASGRRLSDAYNAMDIFVFSSKSETQGMVLVEAMASGKPVVALDASGSREVVKNETNGWLLPEGASIEEFAAALHQIHADPALAQRWRSGALQTAKRFSRRICARKMETLYKRLLSDCDDNSLTPPDVLNPLELMSQRIKTEWELWRRKTEAAVKALKNDAGR
jgi:glycosyltransferase involved in cell wall biosynthesis